MVLDTEEYLPPYLYDPTLCFPQYVFGIRTVSNRRGSFNRELVSICFIRRGSFMGFYRGKSQELRRRDVLKSHRRYALHCINGELDPLAQWTLEDCKVQNPLMFADEPSSGQTATMYVDDVVVEDGNAMGFWAAADILPNTSLTWVYADKDNEEVNRLHRQRPIAYTPGQQAEAVWPRQNPYHLFPKGLPPECVCSCDAER